MQPRKQEPKRWFCAPEQGKMVYDRSFFVEDIVNDTCQVYLNPENIGKGISSTLFNDSTNEAMYRMVLRYSDSRSSHRVLSQLIRCSPISLGQHTS